MIRRLAGHTLTTQIGFERIEAVRTTVSPDAATGSTKKVVEKRRGIIQTILDILSTEGVSRRPSSSSRWRRQARRSCGPFAGSKREKIRRRSATAFFHGLGPALILVSNPILQFTVR
jgi:adenine nucleotide transporter 17